MGLFDKTSMPWSPQARQLIGRAPFFVRPIAIRRTETVARERSMKEVTAELVQELRAKESKG